MFAYNTVSHERKRYQFTSPNTLIFRHFGQGSIWLPQEYLFLEKKIVGHCWKHDWLHMHLKYLVPYLNVLENFRTIQFEGNMKGSYTEIWMATDTIKLHHFHVLPALLSCRWKLGWHYLVLKVHSQDLNRKPASGLLELCLFQLFWSNCKSFFWHEEMNPTAYHLSKSQIKTIVLI